MSRKFTGQRSLSTLVLLLVTSLLLAACGDAPPAVQPTPVGANPTAATTTGGPTTVNVDMDQFKFLPPEITIETGSTVVWTNKEAPKHNVVEDTGAVSSETMNKDAPFSRKFDTPGTFGYFCSFHGSAGQGMAGRVIVVASSASDPDSTATLTGQGANTTPTEVAPALPTATAVPAAPESAGAARFRDNLGRSDQLIISITGLPERAPGKAHYAWLTGAGGAAVNLGRITPNAAGGLDLTHKATDSANLLAAYDTFQITSEDLEATPAAPTGEVVLSGQLPPQALVHIRHLLVSFGATPDAIGLEVGLLGQVEEVRRHAEFMRDSQAKSDLAGVKLHAEHLVNIIEGAKGSNYGDLNKDGNATNPGDGFGLLQAGDQLGYLQGSKDHAELAAVAADATDDIKLHAGHVGVTADNVSGWVTTIRDKSLEVLTAADIAGSDTLVKEIMALANQTLNGVDLKGDGQVLPIPGSGGALTSYQHAQLMAAIPLTASGNGSTQPGSTAQPTNAVDLPATVPPAATAQPSAPPAAGAEVKIDIVDFKYSGPSTVKVGTKVTWTNLDGAPHTSTADNNSFDSGTLRKGQSYSFTVQQAGTFDYFCTLHGGPGKQGMASTLTVEP